MQKQLTTEKNENNKDARAC